MITHHELCFGCGQANLFGLQLELERDGKRARGRFFVKQDHQGPPGYAHGGILAAALDEAMSLAAGDGSDPAVTARLELDLRAPAAIGTFLELQATVEPVGDRRLRGSATARREDGTLVAEARAVLVRI